MNELQSLQSQVMALWFVAVLAAMTLLGVAALALKAIIELEAMRRATHQVQYIKEQDWEEFQAVTGAVADKLGQQPESYDSIDS